MAAVRVLAERCRPYDTALAAWKSGEKTIFSIVKDRGEKKTEGALRVHIIALSMFMNLKTGLTEEHVSYIVKQLMTDYRYYNLADINLLIKRIKEGYYGDFYENLNATKFMECLVKYDIERTAEIERVRDAENKSYQAVPVNPNVRLPYSIEKVGDHMRIVANNEAVASMQERDAVERAKRNISATNKCQGAAEYARVKYQVMYDSIMAKPSDERTQEEINFINQYQNQNQ